MKGANLDGSLKIVFDFLNEGTTLDGGGLPELISDLVRGSEWVPNRVFEAYRNLTDAEFVIVLSCVINEYEID